MRQEWKMQTEIDYLAKNRTKWDRLEELLRKKKRNFDEIRELGNLYLAVSDDLSFCQTHFPGADITSYLNHLVRQCQAVFFRHEKTRLRAILHFFSSEFPRLIFELRYYIAVSCALIAMALALSFYFVERNIMLGEIFLPEKMYDMAVRDLELRRQFGNFDAIPEAHRSALSLYVWFNNSVVAINCFVLGIALGLGTAYILFFNGTMLGALLAVYHMNGHLLDFFSLIMVHGSIELPAIAIAGGAGLSLGVSVINPGRLSRADAVRKEAKRCLKVLAGVIAMLFIAGLVEGLITPLKLPVRERIIIALVNCVVLLLLAARGFILQQDRRLPPAG